MRKWGQSTFPKGNRVGARGQAGRVVVDVRYELDVLDRVVAVEDAVRQLRVGYGYDGLGRRVAVAKPDGTLSTLTWDAASQLSRIRHALGLAGGMGGVSVAVVERTVASASVDIMGFVSDSVELVSASVNGAPLSVSAAGEFTHAVSLSAGTSEFVITGQDRAGNASAVVLRLTLGQASDPDVSGSLSFTYGYDATGNIVTLTDSRTGVSIFGYDPLQRLVSAVRPPGGVLPNETYGYDAVGNRTSSHLSANHTHNAANRLTEDDTYVYDYDANGNRILRQHKTTGVREEYEHDREDKLVGYKVFDGGNSLIRQTRYVYDGIDRRIAKIDDVDGGGPAGAVMTVWHYMEEDIIAEETCAYDGNLEPNKKLKTPTGCHPTGTWLHGPGIDEPVAMVRDRDGNGVLQGGEALVYHTDHLGSVQTLTDTSGSVFAQYFYDSFGNIAQVTDSQSQVISPSQAAGNFYTYTGRELDDESGLYYYRARMYDPAAGVFLEEDPVFSENLYPYVGNDPVKHIDPLGRFSVIPPVPLDKFKDFPPPKPPRRGNKPINPDCPSCPEGLAGCIRDCATSPNPLCRLPILRDSPICDIVDFDSCQKNCWSRCGSTANENCFSGPCAEDLDELLNDNPFTQDGTQDDPWRI